MTDLRKVMDSVQKLEKRFDSVQARRDAAPKIGHRGGEEPSSIISRLGEHYKQRGGGGLLSVGEDGTIGNGMTIVAKFDNKRIATSALKKAGFKDVGYGWKMLAAQ